MDASIAPDNPLGRRLFAAGFGGYIAMMPLNWLSLGSVGGLEIRPSHLATVLLGLALIALRTHRTFSLLKQPLSRRFVLAFVCYLIVMWTSTFTGEFHAVGFVSIIKQGLFLIIFLITAELLADSPLSEYSLARLVYISSAIGVALFIGVANVVFAMRGKIFFVDLFSAVARGDTQMLQFGIYKTLFSAQLKASEINVSFRNGLCGAFCVIFFLILAFSRPALDSASNNFMRFLKWFSLLSCAFVVISSLSRSNILVLLLGTTLGIIPQLRAISSKMLILPVLAIPVVLVGLFLEADKIVERVAPFLSRFEIIAEDARIEMFTRTVAEIGKSDSWLIGAGVGSQIDFGVNKLEVHNLFLAAWYEAGIPALVFAVAFYAILVFTMGQLLLRYPADWWPFECSTYWLAALLTLPLIRMMVGGQGGNMSVNDWFAVTVVLAIVGAARGQFTLQNDVDDSADEREESEESEDGDA